IWVSNTEAFNFGPNESRLQAKFAANRITRILPMNAGGDRTKVVNLNPHIDQSPATSPLSAQDLSLAQPLDLVFQPDGKQADVAAFGSRKFALLVAAGQVVARIAVCFGPAGLALHSNHQRLYVLNLLDATFSVVNLRTRESIATVALRYDPTPAVLKKGRPFL